MPGLIDISKTINYGQPVNWQAPLNKGLVSWWLGLPAGGKSSSILRDLCKRNHGTLTNGPIWGALNRPGGWRAIEYDGSNDYTNIGDPSSMNVTTGDCTLVGWIYLRSATATGSSLAGSILGRSNDNTNVTRTCSLEIMRSSPDNGKLQFQLYDGTHNPFVRTTSTIGVGQWRQCAGVRRNGTIYLYLDGNLITSAADTAIDLSDSGLTWAIGERRDSNFGTNIDAVIDDVRMYMRGLNDSEILGLYNNSRTGYQNELNRFSPLFWLNSSSGPVTVNATPLVINASLIAPLIQHEINTSPVSSLISIVTPNIQKQLSTTPVNLAISFTSSASSSGPNDPDSGVNTDFASATSWSNPGNVLSSNNTYATVTLSTGTNIVSDALDVTDFDFAIPSGATISGVTVEIEEKASGLGSPRDLTIQLIKGGTAQGDNKATGTTWPTVDTYVTYGSSSDKWSLTLTPDDINATDFGIRIRVQVTTSFGTTFSVDHVRVTVNYVTASVLIEHQINTSPLSSLISIVAPNVRHEINTTPVNFVITVVAPNVGQTVTVDTTPVNLLISSITPNLQHQLNTSPVSLLISSVAPNIRHEINAVPVNFTITVVAPNTGQSVVVNTTAINLAISIVSPNLVKEYLLTPLDLDVSLVAPNIQHQINSSPVSIVTSVVTPSLQHEVNSTVLNLSISCIAASIQHEINTTPVNLSITVVTATTSADISEGHVGVIYTPEPVQPKNNLFAAFHERTKFVNNNKLVSEFLLEETTYPYISLGQVFNVLAWKNSCLERFEESNFRINIYCESYWELEEKTEEIENTLIYSTLLLNSPKKVISLEQLEKIQSEIIPQLYRSQLIYEVIVQKEIDQTYILSPTSGETINKCMYERFKNLPLAGMVNDMVSPGYALENKNFPYIVVPTIRENLSWNNTKGRIDNKKYPLTIYSEDLNELLDIMDEVEKMFDYAKFVVSGRNHLINEWTGTDIVEVMPQLWCGKVNYELLVESPIDVFG